MSGYPYGNPGGGYGSHYGMDNNAYPNYPPNNNFQAPPPPSIPMYGDNQSYGCPYPTSDPYMPPNNNYATPSYDANQMPGNSYGFGSGSGYPPTSSFGGQTPSPMFNQPPQPYGGFENTQYQPPYSQGVPAPSSSGIYPHLPASSNYSGGGPAPGYPPQNQHQPYCPQGQSSIELASLEHYQGTVFPAQNFNPEADCQALSYAMQGAGTNEHALIDIIANRSNAQRQQIKLQYKSMYGVDLVRQLGGELSGNFKETITALFDAPANFDAWSLHRALNNGKNGTLREILLTRTNSEIRAIVDVYRRTYNKDLEHEISNRVGGTDFKRILISAIQANRDELTPQQIQQARQMGIESVIDRNRACQDVEALYKAGAGKWGTDERTFNAIFSQRNYYQLRATFEEYHRKYGQDMSKVIRSEFSGDTEDAYLALINCIRDRPAFFAERIHKAIRGLGTNDTTLIRVIVTRSEIDLVQIKQRYQQLYKHSVAQDVSDDTSGDYKRILLAITK